MHAEKLWHAGRRGRGERLLRRRARPSSALGRALAISARRSGSTAASRAVRVLLESALAELEEAGGALGALPARRCRPIRTRLEAIERPAGRAVAPASASTAATLDELIAQRDELARASSRGPEAATRSSARSTRPSSRRREKDAVEWAERLAVERRRVARTLERSVRDRAARARARGRAPPGAVRRGRRRPLRPDGLGRGRVLPGGEPRRGAAAARARRLGRRAVAHHAGAEDADRGRGRRARRSSSTRSTPASAARVAEVDRAEAPAARRAPPGAVGDAPAGDRRVRAIITSAVAKRVAGGPDGVVGARRCRAPSGWRSWRGCWVVSSRARRASMRSSCCACRRARARGRRRTERRRGGGGGEAEMRTGNPRHGDGSDPWHGRDEPRRQYPRGIVLCAGGVAPRGDRRRHVVAPASQREARARACAAGGPRRRRGDDGAGEPDGDDRARPERRCPPLRAGRGAA